MHSKCLILPHLLCFPKRKTYTCLIRRNIIPGPLPCITPEFFFIDIQQESHWFECSTTLVGSILQISLGFWNAGRVLQKWAGLGAGGAALALGHPLEHRSASQSRQNVWSKASRCLTERGEPSENFLHSHQDFFVLFLWNKTLQNVPLLKPKGNEMPVCLW